MSTSADLLRIGESKIFSQEALDCTMELDPSIVQKVLSRPPKKNSLHTLPPTSVSTAEGPEFQFPEEALDFQMLPDPERTPQMTFSDVGSYHFKPKKRAEVEPSRLEKGTLESPKHGDAIEEQQSSLRILSGAHTIFSWKKHVPRIQGARIESDEPESESLQRHVYVLCGLIVVLSCLLLYLVLS